VEFQCSGRGGCRRWSGFDEDVEIEDLTIWRFAIRRLRRLMIEDSRFDNWGDVWRLTIEKINYDEWRLIFDDLRRCLTIWKGDMMHEAKMDVMDSRLAGDVQKHNFDIDMTKRVLRNTRKKPIWYYTKDNDNDFTPPVYIWGVRQTNKTIRNSP
jgi:hypothetical protein